jgi:hypothetical protein
MSTWRKLLASALIAAGSLVVLADVRDGVVDVPAGLVLVVSLAALARTAMRSASDPLRQDAEPPQPRQ